MFKSPQSPFKANRGPTELIKSKTERGYTECNKPLVPIRSDALKKTFSYILP